MDYTDKKVRKLENFKLNGIMDNWVACTNHGVKKEWTLAAST